MKVLLTLLGIFVALVIIANIMSPERSPQSKARLNSDACTLALNLHETLVANGAAESVRRAAYQDVVRACD